MAAKKCRACGREAGKALDSQSPTPRRRGSRLLHPEFCAYHAQAYEKLKLGYEEWSRAYKNVSWEDYLRRVKGRKETGSWVKDVITLELGQGKESE